MESIINNKKESKRKNLMETSAYLYGISQGQRHSQRQSFGNSDDKHSDARNNECDESLGMFDIPFLLVNYIRAYTEPYKHYHNGEHGNGSP